MKLPHDVELLLQRRFASSHANWLAGELGPVDADGSTAAWPLRIALGMPTEREALAHTAAVREWVAAWSACSGAGELTWVQRQWKVLGAQRLPAAITLQGPDEVARWAGQDQRWRQGVARFDALATRWPLLARRLPRLFGALADYSDADFDRLVAMLAWLDANPASGLYLRQLPVPGVDSKWLETRKAILTDMLATLRPGTPPAADFYAISGLLRAPALIRMRVLDPALRARLGGLGDITAPVAQLAQLQLAVDCVLIVENLQSALALQDMAGTVVFMALGYGVDVLSQIDWIKQTRCLYWGDIDTHGFAILNRARAYLPQLESVLMDEATLTRYQSLWTEEKTPSTASELQYLNETEAALQRRLKLNVLGHKVRLEQERLAWEHASAALAERVAG